MEKKNGRPTKYLSEYDQKLVDHMRSGLSFESFAAKVNVNIDTLYEWAKVHKSFSEAKSLGKAKNLLFWEEKGIQGIDKSSKEFNSATWIYTMKCRFPKLWTEKQEIKQATTHSVDNADAILLADLMKELIALKKE